MRRIALASTCVALGVLGLACSPDKVVQGATTGSTAAPPPAAPADAGAPAPVASAAPPKIEFAENDHVRIKHCRQREETTRG